MNPIPERREETGDGSGDARVDASRLSPVASRTLMIMAGGTGGHIFPALSVAEHMQAAGWTIVWLGSRACMEARIVQPKGYTMAWIRFSGLRGKGFIPAAML